MSDILESISFSRLFSAILLADLIILLTVYPWLHLHQLKKIKEHLEDIKNMIIEDKEDENELQS